MSADTDSDNQTGQFHHIVQRDATSNVVIYDTSGVCMNEHDNRQLAAAVLSS